MHIITWFRYTRSGRHQMIMHTIFSSSKRSPGLIMASSVTLNVVTFCFGGTPASLKISIAASDFWNKEQT